MPLNFELGPKKKNLENFATFFQKNFDFIWKIFEFFFFAFLHVLSDFQPQKTKNLLEKKNPEILQLFSKKISILFFGHFYMRVDLV